MKFPWAMDPRSVEALLPKSPDRCDSSSIMLVCYQLWLGLAKLLARRDDDAACLGDVTDRRYTNRVNLETAD